MQRHGWRQTYIVATLLILSACAVACMLIATTADATHHHGDSNVKGKNAAAPLTPKSPLLDSHNVTEPTGNGITAQTGPGGIKTQRRRRRRRRGRKKINFTFRDLLKVLEYEIIRVGINIAGFLVWCAVIYIAAKIVPNFIVFLIRKIWLHDMDSIRNESDAYSDDVAIYATNGRLNDLLVHSDADDDDVGKDISMQITGRTVETATAVRDTSMSFVPDLDQQDNGRLPLHRGGRPSDEGARNDPMDRVLLGTEAVANAIMGEPRRDIIPYSHHVSNSTNTSSGSSSTTTRSRHIARSLKSPTPTSSHGEVVYTLQPRQNRGRGYRSLPMCHHVVRNMVDNNLFLEPDSGASRILHVWDRQSALNFIRIVKVLSTCIIIIFGFILFFTRSLSASNTMSMISSMGVITVVIAVAERYYLRNLIYGILTWVRGTVQLGDVIEINGMTGRVVSFDMSFMYMLPINCDWNIGESIRDVRVYGERGKLVKLRMIPYEDIFTRSLAHFIEVT